MKYYEHKKEENKIHRSLKSLKKWTISRCKTNHVKQKISFESDFPISDFSEEKSAYN